MPGLNQLYEDDLSALAARERLRRLIPRAGHDFSSNDYLGLANSARLRQAVIEALEAGHPVGSGGSRLLRGNAPEHEDLEAQAAAFFGTPAALYFSSGFLANYALLSTLPQRGDLIVYDELIHASCHDGFRASRAESREFPHSDPQAADEVIAAWRQSGGKGRPWIVVESLYSMDGDIAPLADFAAVADRHEAYLLIDEAHGTGVFGPGGRGLSADLDGQENVITLHTCGKALGVEGALICLPKVMREFMVNRCRPLIFSTAPSPLMAATVGAALRIIEDEPERRDQIARRMALTADLVERHCGITPSRTQVQPIIVGEDGKAVKLAAHLQKMGFDIRGIRPPTVPEGTARLRLALTLNVSDETTEDLILAIAEAQRTLFA